MGLDTLTYINVPSSDFVKIIKNNLIDTSPCNKFAPLAMNHFQECSADNLSCSGDYLVNLIKPENMDWRKRQPSFYSGITYDITGSVYAEEDYGTR